MPQSEVSICNQGIGWVGGNLIISLDDESNEAKLCKANYAILRDALLESADWTFGMFRFIPALEAAVPAWGYTRKFRIPAEILRVIYVGQSARPEEDDPVDDWIREGPSILANLDVIYARGIIRVEDPTRFSTLFGQALAARLAMDLAIPIANSRSLQSDMASLFSGKMGEAVAQDAKQGRTRVMRAPGMQQARRAGATNSAIGPTV